VDVLVTYGTPGTLAAKRATTTLPIVMVVSGDAVATGIVASLARPGGNVTGSTFFRPGASRQATRAHQGSLAVREPRCDSAQSRQPLECATDASNGADGQVTQIGAATVRGANARGVRERVFEGGQDPR